MLCSRDMHFQVGDYVEGEEDTLPRKRRTRGWITNFNPNSNFVKICADDCWGGARGTIYLKDTMVKLPQKVQP